MAASTTAATIFQAAEAQTLKDALDTVESDEEIASKAAAAREAKLQQVIISDVQSEDCVVGWKVVNHTCLCTVKCECDQRG